MIVAIDRIGIRLDAMWGVLTVYDADDDIRYQCYTGELASSRIPAGGYLLRRDETGVFRWWRMYGQGVNDGVAGHEAVEFHPMNWPRLQSQACIGLGANIGWLRPPERTQVEQALTDSVIAHKRLLAVLGDDEHELRITEPRRTT